MTGNPSPAFKEFKDILRRFRRDCPDAPALLRGNCLRFGDRFHGWLKEHPSDQARFEGLLASEIHGDVIATAIIQVMKPV
jgi:hypothetical protein